MLFYNVNTSKKRIYGLDILRAIAICYVMHWHGDAYSSAIVPTRYYRWLVLDGVGLFFVLSGFLVGGILIKTVLQQPFTPQRLWHFWLRRWFRTLPAYYLVLSILVVLYYISHSQLPPSLWQYYAFLQNFAGPHPLFFGEAWSLAVEEWFYLLIPAGLLLILQFSRQYRRAFLGWILFVLVIATAFRMGKVMQHDYFATGNFGEEISKVVLMRLDGIMWGMLGAWLSIFRPQWWQQQRNASFLAGLILLFGARIAISYSTPFYTFGYYTASALGTMLLLPKLSTIRSDSGIIFRIVTFISLISYSMYLTNHMFVQRGIIPKLFPVLGINPSLGAWHGMAALLIFWGFTIILSYILYTFWEKPIMNLRERIKDRK